MRELEEGRPVAYGVDFAVGDDDAGVERCEEGGAARRVLLRGYLCAGAERDRCRESERGAEDGAGETRRHDGGVKREELPPRASGSRVDPLNIHADGSAG